jgi:hypothetical protein
MPSRERYIDVLAVSAVGLLAFLAYADVAILNPFNIAWILHGDPATHLYGLLYFIRDPWTLPLGKLFSYGEGFSASIVYTDSIPLLAIVAKLISTATTSYGLFQPLGFWILLCFLLQAWFSFQLAKLFIVERSPCVLIGFLACLAPPLLLRGTAHESLMAHWLIIWALVLVLAEHAQQKALAVWWPLLLLVSLGVHAYIFFMCVGLWAAANVRVLLIRPSSYRRVAVLASGTILGIFVFAYLYGYFVPAAKGLWGYGHYKLNVLAPINPTGWSMVLPSFVDLAGDYFEGFNYFGPGILILLLGASLLGSPKSPFYLGHKILFVSLLVSTAFALTPRFNIGVYSRAASCGILIGVALVLAYGLLPKRTAWGAGALKRHMWRPLLSLTALMVGAGLSAVVLVPVVPERVVGLIRGSGRLFWPTWYFYFFLSCVLLARAMSWRRFCVLLIACSLVQLIDLAPTLSKLNRAHFALSSIEDRLLFVSRHLTNTLEHALTGKRHLSVLADGPMPRGWEQLTFLALRANAGIDKAYYARPPAAYEGSAAARLHEIDRGFFRHDTVYLVYPQYRERVDRAVADSGSGSVVRRAEAGDYLIMWFDAADLWHLNAH